MQPSSLAPLYLCSLGAMTQKVKYWSDSFSIANFALTKRYMFPIVTKRSHVIEVMLLQHDWGYCNLSLGWGTLEGLATFGTNVLVQVSTQKSLLMWNTKIFRGIIFQIIIQIITPKIHCDCVTIVIRHSQTLPANPPTVDALNEATVWHSNSEVSKAMDILLMSPKQWPD